MKALADLREVIASRELVMVLAQREIRARYKYSVLGIGWAIALPLSLTLILTFVFSRVASISTGEVPYPVFVYLGLLPWQMHANILVSGARSLLDNPNLVTKVYFSREALPLSRVAAAFFDFLVGCILLVGLLAWYGIVPGIGSWLLPVVLLVQLMLSTGLAFWVSAGNLLYRDVQYVLQVGVMVWMFASAVVYPIPSDGDFRWLHYLNPITPILDSYRGLILGNTATLTPAFGVSAALSVFVLVTGWRWFRHMERRFGELA
jgi:lipopolysaccharide transport system permease protein